MLNGAQALIKTMVDSGIDTCFTNPGTSEMHFVAALDSSPQMRAVLVLFEGVATGAADGYARMTNKPAATLLHLGCGLGNGLANLHNARKASIPMLNIIGDHATYHVQYNAQLQSDIETVARNVSNWVRTSTSTADLCKDASEAIAVSQSSPRQIATLILPADVSWGQGGVPSVAPSPISGSVIADADLMQLISILKGPGKKLFFCGGRVLKGPALVALAEVAAKVGADILAEVFPTRMERGAGLPKIDRIAYLAEMASVQLAGYDHMILVDAKAPVSFFAYPGKKSYLVPDGCKVHTLASAESDALACLSKLHEALEAKNTPIVLQPASRPSLPGGSLTGDKICQAIGALLPENAIIVDESQTSGVKLPSATAGCPKHDVLTLTGGSIGFGMPNAIGAAVACPDRKVIALVGDGSAMYTIQSLWTMARERLNVVNIIFNNRSYSILNMELQRVGASAGAGEKAQAQLQLNQPEIDFVALAKGMGVKAQRVTTAKAFISALKEALSSQEPYLIDAVIPPNLSGLKLKVLPTVLEKLPKLPISWAKRVKKLLAP